jgi:hypothetical protein
MTPPRKRRKRGRTRERPANLKCEAGADDAVVSAQDGGVYSAGGFWNAKECRIRARWLTQAAQYLEEREKWSQ